MTLLSHYDGTTWNPENGVVTCTSTTRPSSPRDGMIIYETDTGKAFLRSAGAWVAFSTGGSGELIPVRLATGTNQPLSGLANIDSVTPIAGDRILLNGQSTGAQNGIWIAASGAWTRASDADTASEVTRGAMVRSGVEGSNYRLKTFTQTKIVNIVGTDAQEWREHISLDMVGMFTYPTPLSRGHVIFDSNQNALVVWNGSSWIRTGSIPNICTSITRPSATFISNGGLAYETDTNKILVAEGGQWVEIGAGNVVGEAMPVGSIIPWGGTGTPPIGYLTADGSAVSRTTYPELFVAYGTAYGAGDGSTTFNLPDLRGRVPVGAGQGASLTNRNRGDKAGTETHTLAISELPSHTHTPVGYVAPNPPPVNPVAAATAGGGSYGFNYTTDPANVGGGGAHNNMPPFQAIGYLVKAVAGTIGVPVTADPVGSIQVWAGPSAPGGWLLCDGGTYSRTTYAALFAVIGTAYGAGDGSTTFAVPDFRGRDVLGAGQGSSLTNRSRGETGGAETHTLTTAEMPTHLHDIPVDYGPSSMAHMNAQAGRLAQSGTGYGGTGSPATTLYSTPGGTAHNNMQPFGVANWIIKYDAAITGLDTLDWGASSPAGGQAITGTLAIVPMTVGNFRGSGCTLVSSGLLIGTIQINKAGTYSLSGALGFFGGSGGWVEGRVAIYRGGTLLRDFGGVDAIAPGQAYGQVNVTQTVDLLVGDTVGLITATAGTGCTVEGRTHLTVQRLAGAGPVGPQGPPGGAGGVNVNLAGPWLTTDPGPTTGTPFTTPAGVLRAVATATGYVNAAGTALTIRVWIDGVDVGVMNMNPTNLSGTRLSGSSMTFSRTVAAGTHYVAFRQTSGVSDVSDIGVLLGVVTTATGTLDDPVTVLTGIKNGNQSIAAAGFPVLTGWTIQNAYPTWAVENAGVFTVPADGFYRIEFTACNNSTTGTRANGIFINGVLVAQQNSASDTPYEANANVWWEGNLRAGNTVDFRHFSNSAASVMSGVTTRFVIRKVVGQGVISSLSYPDTDWFIPAGGLQNGFANLDANSFDTFAICRKNGICYLRGMLTGGTRTSSTLIFTLPPGYRPGGTAVNVRTHQAVTSGVSIAGDQRVNIGTLDGVVAVNAMDPAGGWFSFTGMNHPIGA